MTKKNSVCCKTEMVYSEDYKGLACTACGMPCDTLEPITSEPQTIQEQEAQKILDELWIIRNELYPILDSLEAGANHAIMYSLMIDIDDLHKELTDYLKQ